MKEFAEMRKRILLTLWISIMALVSLSISGCYPVHLQQSMQADARPEYRTKYFAVKPPKGRWTAKVDTLSFKVPNEGNLLAGVMPERVEFYTVPRVWAVGLEHEPALTISTYPILEPERFNNDPKLMAEAAKERFEHSRERWWSFRQKWTGKLIEVETKPVLKEVKVGGKTFYELSEVYKDNNYIAKGTRPYLLHFTKDRVYVFYPSNLTPDSEVRRVIESFEPLDFKASKEALSLEKALYLLSFAWKWELKTRYQIANDMRYFPYFIDNYSFEKTTQVFQEVIRENPNNYIAHLFLGIHYLTPKEDFYQTVVAPKIKRVGDVQRVLTKKMDDFEPYRFNQMWVVNKSDFYSYFLHGNFDDEAAIAEFKKVLDIKPDSYTARYYLSWLYLRTGEYEKAVLEYKKLLEKDPEDADALLMFSAAYQAMGMEKEAKEFLDALKKVARAGTLYDFLDNFLGPALTEALGRALGEAITRGISH